MLRARIAGAGCFIPARSMRRSQLLRPHGGDGFPRRAKGDAASVLFLQAGETRRCRSGCDGRNAARIRNVRLGNRTRRRHRQARALRRRCAGARLRRRVYNRDRPVGARFQRAPDQFYKFDWVAGKRSTPVARSGHGSFQPPRSPTRRTSVSSCGSTANANKIVIAAR